MTTSTFLSLLYVPVAYTYFDSLGKLLARLFRWRPRFPRGDRDDRGAPATPPRTPAPHSTRASRFLPIAGGAPTRRERVQALRHRGT
jgi:hypothetical protein